MLSYSFANIGSESLYVHLYSCIKNDILKGKIAAGLKLPSKRSFAKNLGISVITVENAYAQLIAEGFIYSIPKKGYFVSDIETVEGKEKIKSAIGDKKAAKYYADLVSNSVLHTLFPFATWAKLLREVILEKSEELMTVPPCSGVLELREAIAEHLYQFKGIRAEPAQIIIGAGTEYLYSLIIKLMGYDKVFAAEEPGYGKISKIYKSSNVVCKHINMDKKGVVPQEIVSSNADVLHISPSHHFPTGTVMPVSRRYELLSWVTGSKYRYIIEDDFDSEFRFSGRAIPPIKELDVMDRVIYMNTFTKSLAPTIRISYMVLPAALAEKYYGELGFYSCTVSNFEQYTLEKFISNGHFENHINRMRRYYKTVRDSFIHAIKNNEALKNAVIEEEDAGLHFTLRVDTDMTDTELKKAFLRNGIRVTCLSDYYVNRENAPKSVIVINYSNLEPEKTDHVVERIADSIKISSKIQ